MTKPHRWEIWAVFLLCALAAISADAQVFTKLFDFEETNGAVPSFPALAQGTDGNFYGTTSRGGTNQSCPGGCGTVFRVTRKGVLTTLHSFCSQMLCADGFYPLGGLILATDGNYYGTTTGGGLRIACGNGEGCGTVFRITPEGKLTTLHRFDGRDGFSPGTGLLQGIDGSLYGTTMAGGVKGRSGYTSGTVFRITLSGNFARVHSFLGAPTEGAYPFAPLVQTPDGIFYGTTSEGGAGCPGQGCGTVFKLTWWGRLTTLHSFNGFEGEDPYTGLTLTTDGKAYGTTLVGGTFESGTVFDLSAPSTYTELYSFYMDGINPESGLVQATDGNLYGTTSSGGPDDGTIFEITPDGTLTTLHSFAGADGGLPMSGLLQATDGILYGTTAIGGDLTCNPNSGCGTIFSLDMGFNAFVKSLRTAGKVGQTAPVLGQGLIGTTTVEFNGTPAYFTVVSDTYIQATVPPGATSGFITVHTPSGTLTSNAPFYVIP